MPPTQEGFGDHEQVGRAVADILVIEPLRLTRLGWQGLHRFADQLLARLVQADQRPPLVVGSVVDLQDILHRTNELGVRLRRDAPLLFQPRLDLVFEDAPHRLVADGVHHLQLDQLVGQKL